MKPDLLAGLRDIHMPEPVSWWPPAIGWWLLLLLLILSMVALFRWLKWRQAQSLKPQQFSRQEMLKQACTELERLEKLASAKADAHTLVTDLSALLRRIAIQLKPEDASISGLSGEAWVQWLDSQWNNDTFACGTGRSLLDAPYQRQGQIDISALLTLSREWIEAQR